MYCTMYERYASKEVMIYETAKGPVATEIIRVCTERGTGVKSGSMDRVLQYMALLL